MQIKQFDHRAMMLAGQLTDLEIRWNEGNRDQESQFFGDIDKAKQELGRLARIDFEKSLQNGDLRDLIEQVARAKATIECDLSYTSPGGVDHDVYYNVGPFLIAEYLKNSDCCKMQDLIVDNITKDQYGDIKIDRQAIVEEALQDDDYFLNEELLDCYIEEIEEAAGWHCLTLEDSEEDRELLAKVFNEFLDRL